MKQLYLDGLYHKTKKLERSFCTQVASERVAKLKLYKQLRLEGCTEETALKAICISRSTYFRWKRALIEKGPKGLELGSKKPKTVRKKQWTIELQSLIYRLRRENPIYGRLKIHALLQREFSGFAKISVATVGRILKRLVELKRILPVWALSSSTRPKRRRIFDKHAQRWKYGMKAVQPGELVQIDHMSVKLGTGKSFKHFQATCPVSKLTVTEVCSGATSAAATKFLSKVKEQMPFQIHSIQVDGGSEFMKDFEAACQMQEIALYVLPPKSPKYNGCVERRNATFKYEFYYRYVGDDNIDSVRVALQLYQARYNTYRPHQALKQDTPMNYYETNFALAA